MKLIEEIITPGKARVYLEGNTMNRPLSKKHVDYLAREINGGRWHFNAETIKFNRSKLRDDAIVACTIKAWNALRQGATIKRLTYRPGSEPVPEII